MNSFLHRLDAERLNLSARTCLVLRTDLLQESSKHSQSSLWLALSVEG